MKAGSSVETQAAGSVASVLTGHVRFRQRFTRSDMSRSRQRNPIYVEDYIMAVLSSDYCPVTNAQNFRHPPYAPDG